MYNIDRIFTRIGNGSGIYEDHSTLWVTVFNYIDDGSVELPKSLHVLGVF